MATIGAIMQFKPNMQRQYTMVNRTGFVVMPVRNRLTPPRTAPPMTQGVRRPYRERLRSEKLPKSRLETSEATAVQALTIPISASGAMPGTCLRCSGRSTMLTIPRPDIHRIPKARKLAPNRNRVFLGTGLPVSGDKSGSFWAATRAALCACRSSELFNIGVVESLIASTSFN